MVVSLNFRTTSSEWYLGASVRMTSIANVLSFGPVLPSLYRARKSAPKQDVENFHSKCKQLRQRAAGQKQVQPVSFAVRNSWADKVHYKEYCKKSDIGASSQLVSFFPHVTWCTF